MITATDMGRVAVLCGGWAAEREVSLVSGRNAYEALKRRGVDAELIDVTPEILRELTPARCDRAFIALHGRGGEDGIAQAVLELAGIPYTGSDPAASALTMNKIMTKRVWQGCGLPTPDFAVLTPRTDWQAVIDRLGAPVFVKPACEGSSIGMNKAASAAELRDAYECARQYDEWVLAESFIDGGEYTGAVLAGECLPIVRIRPAAAFYDYDAKYSDDAETEYDCPAGLDEVLEQRLRALSLQAFEAAGAAGWGRVDILLDGDRRPWLLELNTTPGLTSHSLAPMAARTAGMDFDEFIWRVLLTSVREAT